MAGVARPSSQSKNEKRVDVEKNMEMDESKELILIYMHICTHTCRHANIEIQIHIFT